MHLVARIIEVTIALGFAGVAPHPCKIDGKEVDIMKYDTVIKAETFSGAAICADGQGHIYDEARYKNGKRVWSREYNFNPYKVSRESELDAEGEYHGVYKQFDSNGEGKLEYESSYVHGKQQGLSKAYYYQTGKLREQRYYEAGDSLASLSYTQSGKLYDISCTQKAAPAPFRKACGFDGSVTHDMFHVSDVKTGTQTYKNGIQVASKQIGESGEAARSEENVGDIKLTVMKFPDGKTKKETRRDRQMNPHGTQREFDESGTLTREETFDHGRLLKSEAFYLNGQLKESVGAEYSSADQAIRIKKTFYDSGKLRTSERMLYSLQRTGYGQTWVEQNDGLREEFDENGLPVLVEPWKSGKRDGVVKSFHQDSRQLAAEQTYKMDVLAHDKVYSRQGEVVRDDELFKDGSRKSMLKKTGK